ncbi:bifunctional folylpolyglutamate synthase/dihydrofolate synthase [Leifsonia sp. Root112D2]|jgi:dihydrofolate synthase/folylpolyglutamate synthase|uniref:bifunctional folylpolyglutamate synthase/dihydrofolate synthase n=1 Tax=Leifsonia sp. Root112D2 TaxID=1736426 RepID=UPI0006F4C53F|nr:folylpolyglutamate synthase/dihydrofolate synthase family protein [Leifsonia sp. Root112D2]KQV07828.1 dihydrofolate synthase [Leifsonia sp. Root112D2]
MTDEPQEDDFTAAGDAVYETLLTRLGEANPQPRLDATRRAVELLGDPHRAYPIIHVTGTNGKTSTSRIAASILRAYGLRVGLFTSPHLVRFNERIMIDGSPISNEALARNWQDIAPYIEMTDAALEAEGQVRLTFFEVMTVLAFACFADATVDVAVIEVGMGGEWDSTNVGDGQVAVFTPISLDHMARLGNTVAEIARTKSGIIKPAADVVSSVQTPEALAELKRAAELSESTLAVQGVAFDVVSTDVAVGGQLVTVRGLAGTYEALFLPLYGDHQAQNAAVAVAAVESFLGRGTQPLKHDLVEEGFATATSPGRLQLVGTDPTVLVDAAHNPSGAASLAAALKTYFDFDEIVVVLAVLADKDAHGIVDELAPVVTRFNVTQSRSDRALSHEDLTERVMHWTRPDMTFEYDDLYSALDDARAWAGAAPRRAVVVTGSIVLTGEAMAIAEDRGWKES